MLTNSRKPRRPTRPGLVVAPRRRGRPISTGSTTVTTALPLVVKGELVEEAEALTMPLGVYVAALLLGLDRSERLRAARYGSSATPRDDDQPAPELEL